MALRADDVDLGRDRVLVEQIQDGDRAAFEDLYRRYYGRLYRFCLRRMGDPHEAEDVTQEAFARAYRAMPGLRGEKRFYPWLSVIASRLCIDTHRRLDRTEPSAEVDPGAVEGGHDRLESAVDFELLQQAMTRLNARHREVLHLREREGWSYQRIADHYDCSIGTVEGLLFRARHALRREFIAVAGPEAGLAAGLPPIAGLGWFGRKLTAVRARATDWAAALGNMPALAANSVAIAVVVSSAAAGISAIDFTPSQSRPVNVAVASPVSSTSPLAAGGAMQGAFAATAAQPHAPAGTGDERTRPGPIVDLDGTKDGTRDAVNTLEPTTNLEMLDGDDAEERADDQSVTADTGIVTVGVEPDDIANALTEPLENQR